LLTTGGALYSTGYNGQGQLGLGDTTNRSSFTLVSNITNVADIYTCEGRVDSTNWIFANFAFARLTNGDLYAAGYNGYGQLGLGDTTQRTSFTKITSLANIAGVTSAGGGYYGCPIAWTTTGVVYSWGYNGSGAIGDGSTTNRSTPWQIVGWAENTVAAPPFQGKIQQVQDLGSALGHQAAAILDTDGNIWSVGQDANGQGGTGLQQNNSRYTRVRMPTLNVGENITSLGKAGYDNVVNLLALSNQGRLFISGYNGYGNAGNLSVRSTTYLYTLQPVNF
jgi:alpha-tubulin suppressor-like RCC1 family protein